MRPTLLTKPFLGLVALAIFLHTSLTKAQAPKDYTLPVTATIVGNAIALHWQKTDDSPSFSLARRESSTTGQPAGGIFTSIHGHISDTGYTDATVVPGILYEYRVTKFYVLNGTSESAVNVIATGIGIATLETRGKVLLITEDSIAGFVASNLRQLEADLSCDGWTVVSKTIAKTISPRDVKAIIGTEAAIQSPELEAVFLLGHVPVPYSGDFAPDGHEPPLDFQKGAWSADAYYGDLTGTWTDLSVNDATASRPANRNIPGDGKFDQSVIPGTVTLQIGRVDFYDMPSLLTIARPMDDRLGRIPFK